MSISLNRDNVYYTELLGLVSKLPCHSERSEESRTTTMKTLYERKSTPLPSPPRGRSQYIQNQTHIWKLNTPSHRKEINKMPSPMGEGQTDMPINRHNRGEVELPFTHSPLFILEVGDIEAGLSIHSQFG